MNNDTLDPVTDDRDKLAQIFRQQKAFNTYLQVTRTHAGNLMKDYEIEIRELVLATIVEAVEVLNEINWKPWKIQSKPISEERLKEEIIDLFHFVIELAVVVKMDSEEFFELYQKKMKINIRRQNADSI